MITIVGGTYHEKCLEPVWEETYGSGLRACRAIFTLDPNCKIRFNTFLEAGLISYFNGFAGIYKGFSYNYHEIPDTPIFYYDYPLSNARIFPRLDTIAKHKNFLEVEGDCVLQYGFIEGTAKIKGRKVVYDPQSPVAPTPFHTTGSAAQELAVVINWGEAKEMAGSDDINEIKHYFFTEENADVVIIKMGAKGALVSTAIGNELIIPVYKTENVWSIGSGDIFAAVFSYWWFNNDNPFDAAKKASYATAEYCNCGDYQFSEFEQNKRIIPLKIKEIPKGQIYLAGPFFTFAQRWLIDQIRKAFMNMQLKVFSPLHDVGYGHPFDVVEKDLIALNECSIVFAVLDGLDAGTLFEVGYAVSKDIAVIGYVQNESIESLTMLSGTNCAIESDLTTAIYKSYWKLAENE